MKLHDKVVAVLVAGLVVAAGQVAWASAQVAVRVRRFVNVAPRVLGFQVTVHPGVTPDAGPEFRRRGHDQISLRT